MSCDSDPGWNISLSIPYFESTTNYSHAPCVALWSYACGVQESEENILNWIGTYFDMWDLAWAVDMFTDSTGWVVDFPNTDAGQNMALSAVSESLEDDNPSIVPMYAGDVFWLAIGGKGHYNGVRPVADHMRFHYTGFEGLLFSAGEIKNVFFMPVSGTYTTIVGFWKYEKLLPLQKNLWVNFGTGKSPRV